MVKGVWPGVLLSRYSDEGNSTVVVTSFHQSVYSERTTGWNRVHTKVSGIRYQLTTFTTSQQQLLSCTRYSTTSLCPFQAAANTGVHWCWKQQQQHNNYMKLHDYKLLPLMTHYNICCFYLQACCIASGFKLADNLMKWWICEQALDRPCPFCPAHTHRPPQGALLSECGHRRQQNGPQSIQTAGT